MSEALPLLERAADPGTSGGLEEATVSAFLGEAYLLIDRNAEARELGERALELAQAHRERGNQAWGLRLLGEVTARRDPPELQSVERQCREALALAEDLAMRTLQAHCHLGLGKLYRRIGKRDQAQDHLATATEMYRQMDMRFWLEQAEAEINQ